MSVRDDGGPAYPVGPDVGVKHGWHDVHQGGVSVRDYFAIRLAVARVTFEKRQQGTSWDEFINLESKLAYEFADAMLEARKR